MSSASSATSLRQRSRRKRPSSAQNIPVTYDPQLADTDFKWSEMNPRSSGSLPAVRTATLISSRLLSVYSVRRYLDLIAIRLKLRDALEKHRETTERQSCLFVEDVSAEFATPQPKIRAFDRKESFRTARKAALFKHRFAREAYWFELSSFVPRNRDLSLEAASAGDIQKFSQLPAK